MTDPVVWLNGALLPQSVARLDPLARGFLHGMGVYDALLFHRGVPVAIERHAVRLADGAARLGLQAPDADTMAKAIAALAGACGLTEAGIRITLAAGAWAGFVPPPDAPQVCLITAAPVTTAKAHAAVVTSPWRRNECSPLAGIKFTACAESLLAQRAALAGGADEAIFLNTKLHLCEGAFSNVFIVREGAVLTPPLSSGCLPGVTRDVVIALCREHGIDCREEDMAASVAVREAEEAFLTSSIRGIQPVSSYDGLPLPSPGPLTQRLMTHYASWLEAS